MILMMPDINALKQYFFAEKRIIVVCWCRYVLNQFVETVYFGARELSSVLSAISPFVFLGGDIAEECCLDILSVCCPEDGFRTCVHEVVVAALDPFYAFLRCGQIFIEDSQSGGRTDVVAESGTADLHLGVFDSLGHEDGIVVIQSGGVFQGAAGEASLLQGTGQIACPDNLNDNGSHIRVKCGKPYGLKSALAGAACFQVLAVPLGAGLEVFREKTE